MSTLLVKGHVIHLKPHNHTRSQSLAASLPELPTDVLYEIFCHLVKDQDSDLGYCHWQLNDFKSASQVCRIWRHVAVNAALLWAQVLDIQEASPAWFDEILNRTQGAPLTVNAVLFHPSHGFSSLQWQSLLHHVPRIRELHLSHAQLTDMRPLEMALSQTTPNLEALSIGFNAEKIEHRDHIHLPVRISPTSLCNGYAPRLRHLSLENCIIDVFSPALRQLTCLQSANSVDIEGIQLSPSDWVTALQNMPLLNHLELLGLSEPSSARPLDQRVYLPHLQSLALDGDLTSCIYISSSLEIPESCNVTVSCYVFSPDNEHKDTILAPGVIRDIAALWDIDSPCSTWTMSMSDSRLRIQSQQGGRQTYFELRPIYETNTLGLYSEFLILFSEETNFQKIASTAWLSLDLRVQVEIYDTLLQAFVSFLSSFPYLSRLHLSENAINTLIVPVLQGHKPEILPRNREVYDEWPVILPFLTHFKVSAEVCQDLGTRAIVQRFLKWRKDVQRPINAFGIESFGLIEDC